MKKKIYGQEYALPTVFTKDADIKPGFNQHQEIAIRFMAAMLGNPNYTERMNFFEISHEATEATKCFIEVYNQ